MGKGSEGYFKLKSITNFSDFEVGDKIGKSDLALQDDERFYQFELIGEEKGTFKLEPKIYDLVASQKGIIPKPVSLIQERVLKTNKNSEKIIKEFDFFFKRLHIYEKLKIKQKSRKILIYGPPGTSKTTSWKQACLDLVQNGDTAVVLWNASELRSSQVSSFLSNYVEYGDKVKKLVIVIEDIGMSVESFGGPKEVDRSLLNMLDGASEVFKVPTFVVGTTNYAHNLPEPLVRPGRFDVWIEANLPTEDERVELYKFISGEELSEEDIAILRSNKCKDFSIAHIKELAVRKLLNEMELSEVVNELFNYQKKFKKGFEKSSGVGL